MGTITATPGHRRRAVLLRLLLALLIAGFGRGALAEVSVELLVPGPDAWLHPRDTLVLRVQAEATPRLAVLLGNRDITRLLRRERSGELRYASDVVPLPSGEQDLVVYRIESALEWIELARFPVRVLTPGGLEVSEIDPRLDLSETSQFDEGHNEGAAPPPRARFNDFALQAGFVTRHRIAERELRSSWNFVGSSVEEQALRFATEGAGAPRIDLSDFLVEYQASNALLSLGHISYGSHPLLLNGLANRGLSYRMSAFDRLDISVARQNAQSIVGSRNLTGLGGSDNYVAAATVGYELAARPGAARIEAMYLNARTQSLLDFNVGEVPDAERNVAYGFRFATATASGRVTAAASFARSTYTNPADPFLGLDPAIVPVAESTADAHAVDLSLDLLQGNRVSAVLRLRHARAEPLYRTVGAFVSPDLDSRAASLEAVLGQASVQLQLSRAEDNLENIPTILKTRSDSASFNASLPLATLLAPEAERPWLPAGMTYGYQRLHQAGVNRPPSFDPATHIPDQVSENHNLGLVWSFGSTSLSYRYGYGLQDNRQPGRATADFDSSAHGIDLLLQPFANLGLTFGAAYAIAGDRAQDLDRRDLSYTFGFDLALGETLNLRGNYSLAEADDSGGLAESRNHTSQTEVYWRFEIPARWRERLPGQLYLRHSLQSSGFSDNIFGFDSLARSWTWTAGFNISLL